MIWGILAFAGIFAVGWAWASYRERLNDDSKRAKAMDTTEKVVGGIGTAWNVIRGVGLIAVGLVGIFGLRDATGIGFGILLIGAGIYFLV